MTCTCDNACRCRWGARARALPRTNAELPINPRKVPRREHGVLFETANDVGRARLPRCRKCARVVFRHARANQLDVELIGWCRRVRRLLKDEVAPAKHYVELRGFEAEQFPHLHHLRFAEDVRALRGRERSGVNYCDEYAIFGMMR